MTEQLRNLDSMVSVGVANLERPTPGAIRDLISTLRRTPMFPDVTDGDAEALARQLEERIGVSMGLGALVEDEDFRPWLNDAKIAGEIVPYYWPRYEKLLRAKGLPRDVVAKTDQVTDRVLERLGNPRNPNPWSRQGMVVGHVQSGKTANYLGLVCKAADAGYRLIVVIAGIHNNLRNQTQGRIDEGFIGRDTGRLHKGAGGQKIIGVGRYDSTHMPVSLTNTIRDFNKATATSNTSQIGSYSVPVVLVIKKNASTLRNLIEWLREHSAHAGSEMVEQPMLLIDDEADNASINIKYTKDEISRINGQIRDLCALFRRSCYVGYTATPFANIFIDPDTEDDVLKEDLFPRHFIVGLDAPTNYFGPQKVFLDGMPEEGDPDHLRFITDNGDVLPVTHRIDRPVDVLPGSLVRALRAFIVARAIRNLRGQAASHASMLVNASRFTGVQGRIRNRLEEHIEEIRNAVRIHGATGAAALGNPEIAALHDVWLEEYANAHPDWETIQQELHAITEAIRVVEVNSRTNELDYSEAGENGVTVVAVGGFSLSRGLTLEGLTVSYFLRNSMMYDTLMQMGRWFGYRTDYEDLCRIWMRREAADWYAHIAEATEELQLELKRMEQARATPLAFGLAVRSHPSALMVTARNKMGSGQKQVLIGLSNSFVETTKLDPDPKALKRNRETAAQLVDDLSALGFGPDTHPIRSGGHLLSGVPVDLIDRFLLRFANSPASFLSQTRPIRDYISERANDELAGWDVFVASVSGGETDPFPIGTNWEIGPATRGVGLQELRSGLLAIGGKKSRVASRGVERIGIPEHLAAEIEADFARRKEKQSGNGKINYPDRIYREHRPRPLFILYALQLKVSDAEADEVTEADQALLPKEPVIAWGISFPRSAKEHQKVEYVVNTTKMREMYGDPEHDDDEGPYEE